ncbi:MAG: B12-binding domain-containing radical SAM protein [Candidatus Lloydbacteria bacterium CG22_combo_CG10-13_8_21_14_all_47_15]|uniref:B12-binding domain-containing radical SAM protein n=1 Tax=Candidatus Lloydbacteria bacterium CG22_combo_CG10-13_8_21_14_all_47_15 TaxID=1974635 RepID=A0A2H0CTU3_9BACT|nr:MAG: B12-binding domain-containing radical SAM protein [Candidatus Lloydbacteria bacterium CG22_combo_CG10-13_8_21_14_all_47_15]
MKVLFVYPLFPPLTYWGFKTPLKFLSKKALQPPLGLLTVAAMLPYEWEKKLVDMNVATLTDKDILWADMVFISAMLAQRISAQDVIDRSRAFGKKIVAGGPAFTTQKDAFSGVDHFVLDEAEVTLPLFLEDVQKGTLRRVYTSDEKPDVTHVPVPLWSLLAEPKKYGALSIQYSRGCPFNCEFCDIIIMNGRRPRMKLSAQIVAELDALYKIGWRDSIFIVDDNFIGNKREVKNMLVAVIAWQKKMKYPFKLFTEASIDLARDKELMDLMRLANFYKVFIGIETPNMTSLEECQKVQNTKDNLVESVRTIQEHGMQVMGGFIVGFDNDPEDIFEMQTRFIQETGIVTAMVGLLTALPGTQLWHRLEAENRLLHVSSGENTDGTLNFMPRMDREKLLTGYQQILDSIYSPKNYYLRIEQFLAYYRPTVRSRYSFKNVLALFKSIFRIGIRSKQRMLYWKLLLKTFFTHIRAFPTVVELAIYGLHFAEITEKIRLERLERQQQIA